MPSPVQEEPAAEQERHISNAIKEILAPTNAQQDALNGARVRLRRASTTSGKEQMGNKRNGRERNGSSRRRQAGAACNLRRSI
uniref:Uncharacterized protein n=1 Tax=Arundo donax TaxID=35708 RepID=A0A0A8Y906_ARUDO